jgi:mannose-6-phosphate isomerase-like protein (cupin superfamily)
MGTTMNSATGNSIVAAGVQYVAGERDTRPWGTWEVLATGSGYALKRITVLPGQRLSLQYHKHRAEHWTIVSGEAEVEVGGDAFRLVSGEHIFIPLGATHRIHNSGGQGPLIFIEVQIGEHLDEHDIIRLDDDYGRTSNYAA